MQLCLLQLDDALDAQTSFIQACDRAGARRIQMREHGSRIRLWGYHAEIAAFQEKLSHALDGTSQPRLTFIGSGDFHHVTALLLAAALQHHAEPVTLIHVDNHPDWVHFEKGMHCGSWINNPIEHPQVQKIITIGVCSDDLRLPEPKKANLALLSRGLLELYPYDHPPSRVSNDYGAGASFEQVGGELHWKTIRSLGEQNFAGHLLSRIKTEKVYLTIDKDVLARDDAVTNWDQGCMRLPYLLSLIGNIAKHHRLVGADVIGDYSKPRYSGSLRTQLYKRVEVFKDQSRRKPDPKHTADLNSGVNLTLLDALSEAMA